MCTDIKRCGRFTYVQTSLGMDDLLVYRHHQVLMIYLCVLTSLGMYDLLVCTDITIGLEDLLV